MKDLCSDREVRLKFLLEAGKALQSKCTSVATYLNTYGSNLARNFNSSLPACWTKKNLVCLYCLTPWNRDKYSVSLRPTVKPSKKIQYIIRKQDKNKRCSFIEKKLAAIVHPGNRIVLKCLICSKTTPFLINKGHIQKMTSVIKKPTKKKKKKDPLAGLSPAVSEVVKELNNKADRKSKQVLQFGTNYLGDVKVAEDVDFITDEQKSQIISDCKQTDSNKWLCSSGRGKDGSRLRIKAPLGTKPTEFDNNSRAEPFIPLNSNLKRERRFNAGAPQRSNVSFQSQKEKPTKFINPFAVANQNRSKKKQKKRADHLEQIIAEEKSKSKGKSSSFKDFLTLV